MNINFIVSAAKKKYIYFSYSLSFLLSVDARCKLISCGIRFRILRVYTRSILISSFCAALSFAYICAYLCGISYTRNIARAQQFFFFFFSLSLATKTDAPRLSRCPVLFLLFCARITKRNVDARTETHYAACIFINGSASLYVRAFLTAAAWKRRCWREERAMHIYYPLRRRVASPIQNLSVNQ